MKRLAIAALITTTGCASVNAMDKGRLVTAAVVAGFAAAASVSSELPISFNTHPVVLLTQADFLPDTHSQQAYQPREAGKEKPRDKIRHSSQSHVNKQPRPHGRRHGQTFTATATVVHNVGRAAHKASNTGTRRERARNKSPQR